MIALDIRSARRGLMRSRAYAVGVVAALAISIAGTALVFGVFQAVLLKPLPFSDPDRLVWVWATRTDRDKAFFSIADYEDYRRATTTLQNVDCLRVTCFTGAPSLFAPELTTRMNLGVIIRGDETCRQRNEGELTVR